MISIVLPLILDSLGSNIGKQSSVMLKKVINKISTRLWGREIFKKKVSELTVEELQELFREQITIVLDIIEEELHDELPQVESGKIIQKIADDVTTVTKSVTSIHELAQQNMQLIQNLDVGEETKKMWKEETRFFLSECQKISEEQTQFILSMIQSTSRHLYIQIEEMRSQIDHLNGDVKEIKNLIAHQLEEIKKFVDVLKIPRYENIQVVIDQQKHVKHTITCRKCHHHQPLDPKSLIQTWKCPKCNTFHDHESLNRQITAMSIPKIHVLSMINQLVALKSSRGGERFNSYQYVPRKKLHQNFSIFEQNFQEKKKIFMVLGDVGMGKTWALSALAEYYLRQKKPAFYFSLRKNFLMDMKDLFFMEYEHGWFDKLEAKLREVSRCLEPIPFLFLFDGYDEILSIERKREFFELIRILQRIPRLRIVISSRTHAWNADSMYLEYKDLMDQFISIKHVLEEYDDEEYQLAVRDLTKIKPLWEWEQEWGRCLRTPYLLSIIKKMAQDQQQFVEITNEHFFIQLERRLQLEEKHKPIMKKFARAFIKGETCTYDDFNSSEYQILDELRTKGIITEQDRKGGFTTYQLNHIIHQAYACYLYFNKNDNEDEWSLVQQSEKIDSMVQKWLLKLFKDKFSLPPKQEHEADEISHDKYDITYQFQSKMTSTLEKEQKHRLTFQNLLWTIEKQLNNGKIDNLFPLIQDLRDMATTETEKKKTHELQSRLEHLSLKTLERYLGKQIPVIRDLSSEDPLAVVIDDNTNHVITLVICNQELSTIPEIIGNLVNLEHLDLRANELTTIPEAIGNLVNLKHLNLGSNQLTEIPDTIENLTNLEELNLSFNELTTLPDTIGNLVNLKNLNLSFNELTTLPDTIGNLVNLQFLYLYKNKLTTLPDTIENLTNLKELNLGLNKLTTLPRRLVIWISRLKEKNCKVIL